MESKDCYYYDNGYCQMWNMTHGGNSIHGYVVQGCVGPRPACIRTKEQVETERIEKKDW